jgi:hypothetical protein
MGRKDHIPRFRDAESIRRKASHGRHDTNGALANVAIRSAMPTPFPHDLQLRTICALAADESNEDLLWLSR